MPRKASVLNSKAFHIVIDKYDKLNDKYLDSIDIVTMLSEMPSVKEWSFILHDKDHTREHYHINILLETAHQAQTILYNIAGDLMINVDCIGVKSINLDTLFRRQRYLVHLDNKDKYQYKVEDVVTNNTDNFLDCISGRNPYILDIESLYKICCECNSLAQVYKEIGLLKSNTYRGIINDIWKEVLNKRVKET